MAECFYLEKKKEFAKKILQHYLEKKQDPQVFTQKIESENLVINFNCINFFSLNFCIL